MSWLKRIWTAYRSQRRWVQVSIAVIVGFFLIAVIEAGVRPQNKTSATSLVPTSTTVRPPPLASKVALAPRAAAQPPATTVPPPTTTTTVPPTTTTTIRVTTTTTSPPTTTTQAVIAAPPPTQAPTASASAASLCGAPPNPYGDNYCGHGSLIFSPQANICSYFSCIGNFYNGSGYMEACQDGMVSMSGGRRGACSYHGGELHPVYSGS